VRTGPVRIEHRETNRVRILGWHAASFDAVFDSLIAEGARGEVALVSVETGEVLMRRAIVRPAPDGAIVEALAPESLPDA
jgi:hypothetical protein